MSHESKPVILSPENSRIDLLRHEMQICSKDVGSHREHNTESMTKTLRALSRPLTGLLKAFNKAFDRPLEHLVKAFSKPL